MEFHSLTPRGKARRYRRALLQALEAYPVTVRSLRFVSMDSKPVFRVETDRGLFAAKFHDPREHRLAQMRGEMRFLDHVSRETELRIENPLANARGRAVTEVRSEWLPAPAHIALCRWLPGRPLRDAISARSYGQLGRCSAMLHRASRTFRRGRSFHILTNDRVFYWDRETILSRGDRRVLPKSRQEVIRRSARQAQRAIRTIWRSGRPIVIHNDLHPSNIKVHRGELCLYDFEDITWGFPAQDIGTAMYYVRFRPEYAALLDAFRGGYEDVARWPLDSDRQLDRFIMARVLMLANYVVNFDIRPAELLPGFEKKLRRLGGEDASAR